MADILNTYPIEPREHESDRIIAEYEHFFKGLKLLAFFFGTLTLLSLVIVGVVYVGAKSVIGMEFQSREYKAVILK